MTILRDFVKRTITESRVGASDDYLKKEDVRRSIQDMVTMMVKDGRISTQNDLEDVFKTMTMAISSLKMVPLDAFKRLETKRTKS